MLPAVLAVEWPVPYSVIALGPMSSGVRMPSSRSTLCHAGVAQLHKPLRHVLGGFTQSPAVMLCSVASEMACLFLTCPGHPAV